MVVCPLDCRKLWKKICNGPRIAQCFLIGINVIVMITGICFFAIGAYFIAATIDFLGFYDPGFASVAIGGITFLVGLCGCCAAYRNSFGVLLPLIVSFDDYVLEDLKGRLKMLNCTSEHRDISDWDRLQERFKCCGVYSSDDWQTKTNLDPPASCCEPVDGWPTNCNTTDKTKLYTPGCATEFVPWVENIGCIIERFLIAFLISPVLFAFTVCITVHKNGMLKFGPQWSSILQNSVWD